MHALDRLTCTVTLRMADIPMPPTVVTENLAEAEAAVKRFGTAVLKPLYTSKARGMQIVEAGPQAETQLRAFQAAGNAMMYVQQLLDLPGHDFGIAFLGGEYLGAYARVQRGDSWHTAMSAGGNKYQSIEPPPEFIDLARRAQAPFNLDFTCVDVVETKAGPLVFEVSAFGGFRGLREAADIDAGGAFTDYVLQKISDDG
jgi:ribosomal protein S6--L-glutamate ligase